MKRYLVLWLLMISWSLLGQQIPVATIFVESPFAFNPAVAGSDNGFKIRLNSRMQWLGFGDGPFTNMVSLYGPHAVRNIGYGANLTVDQTGPISMLKGNGGFATNFFITSDIRTSLGLNLGFIQYKADGSQFDFPGAPSLNGGSPPAVADPAAPSVPMSSIMPDAGAGIYVYHFDWYVGISAQQLFNNNVKFSAETNDNKLNKIMPHFFLYAGHKFYLGSQKLVFEPTILSRIVPSLPMQLDICARIIYDRNFWGGISARNTFESFNDLSLIFGYIHERRIHVALSYDFTFAQIRNYSAGTIELVLGYNFDEVKRGR